MLCVTFRKIFYFCFEEAKLTQLNWHWGELNLRPRRGAHFQILNQYHRGQPKWVSRKMFDIRDRDKFK